MLQGNTYYIVPWTNPLAQKLAGSGQILTSATSSCDPGSLPLSTPAPQSYPITIVELDASAEQPERHRLRQRLRALTHVERKNHARCAP